MPAQKPDPITGHHPGWLPIGDGPEDKWHRAVWEDITAAAETTDDGTYELCGPHVQGNSESFAFDVLLPHGAVVLHDVPRDFAGIRAYLVEQVIEGIVWHHPDGRLCKIKRRDFGLPWPIKH